MKAAGVLPVAVLAAVLALAGCDRGDAPRSHTAVLGGSAPGTAPGAAQWSLTDARGRGIPPPLLPPGATARAVRSADESALAVWVQDGHVVACTYAPATGWSAAQPLESIYGQASDPQLVSNGKGPAMAVWRHTVGNILSLRFSRYEPGAGWSQPDVMPGALPRPPSQGAAAGRDAPQLEMDARGNVLARWPSGFRAGEVQTARYVDGQGWTRAESEQVASSARAAASGR